MADLENLLLEAAGRTGATGRKPPSHSKLKRPREGSYSDDGSDSRDDDSDDPVFASRKPSGSQVPLKKRLDPTEKDDDRGSDEDDDVRRGGSGDDDSDSAPSIGSDLYFDDADREELSKLSELDREMILTERADKKDDWLKKRKGSHSEKKTTRSRKESSPPMTSSRGRLSVKSHKTAAKDDALNELRAKRKKQQDSEGQHKMRDAAGGVGGGGRDSSPIRRKPVAVASPSSDSSGSESRSGSDSGDEGSTGGGDLAESDEEGPSSGTEKPTYEDIKEITIRRSKLAKWFMEPFFEDLIVGCFVRVGIGMTRSGQSIYRLCMVRNVDSSEPDRLYKLENRSTYKYLNCIWGNESSAARWQMARVSDSAPPEKEFNEWVREVERSNGRMMSRKDVLEKRDAIQKINTFVYSAATVKQMLQEKKSASSRPLNIAAEKDRLRKELEVAESRRDVEEVERIQTRLKELENMSRQVKEKDSKAVRLAEMNKKNRAENFKNASELKPVNTGLKAGEAGYDPFSRRWTRSTNYYVSKAGAATNGDTATPVPGAIVGLVSEVGEAATAAALEAAADAGKLVDTSAPVDQGTELNSMHDFELPISLAVLQKFGGPQGAHLGFMARKQRFEATIGFQVPENDGRRHPLTLTVSDYKRRRGLL
ncbi:plus-3 domain-containing protein [Tasmannia lanceolata]|uniref:plus-3 domain-containing protein n=1 Tax=Tasmannia lanceolata TaxID=3420 RepID=UPI004064C288